MEALNAIIVGIGGASVFLVFVIHSARIWGYHYTHGKYKALCEIMSEDEAKQVTEDEF